MKKYKAKYGVVPDAMAALGYDSAMILADAIKRAGSTDGAKLRDALAATKDFKAVTGSITLDEHRNATKAAVILTISDGKFKFDQTVAPRHEVGGEGRQEIRQRKSCSIIPILYRILPSVPNFQLP